MSQQQEDEINAGKRMKEFMEDEAVKAIFVRLDQTYFAEFKGADSEEKRTSAWAKSKALDDIAASMRATWDRGKVAQVQKEQAAAAVERQERHASRTRR